MHIPWHTILAQPSVRQLAKVLHERWPVWLGLVPAGGAMEPISLLPSGVRVQRPLCERFMANPLPLDEFNEMASCQGSVRAWGAPGAPLGQPGQTVMCHAGMHALTLPVLAPRVPGGVAGTLYLSGFLPERLGARGDLGLRRALRSTGAGRTVEEERWFEHVPKFSPTQESVAGGLLEALGQEIARHVTAHLALRSTDEIPSNAFCGILGASQAMRDLFGLIDRVAKTTSTVLILGENGTGKELVARALYQCSRRSTRPFVAQNCAAIPGDLMESELFGHKKGAFSGAHRDREGLLEAANYGTFFLDEIGEMSLALQSKLLRVLQDGVFLPVGDEVMKKVDVRFVCATNRPLANMVAQGSFRKDLYYRINVITLRIPPLRDRREDIPLLARHFLARALQHQGLGELTLSERALGRMMEYDWPGNIRELENEIERLVIFAPPRGEIEERLLSTKFFGPEAALEEESEGGWGVLRADPGSLTLPEAVDQLERQMIRKSLEAHGGNKSKASKALGISRRNLIRKVAAYEAQDGHDD